MIPKRKVFFSAVFTLIFSLSVFAFEHRSGVKRTAKSAYFLLRAQIRADTLPLIGDYVLRKQVRIQTDRIDEASGITPSFSNAGCWYTHNDSNNPNEVFLLDSLGALRSVIKLKGAENVDWEDISSGPGPKKGVHYVYVGDIGDNRYQRKHIAVYRFADPKISSDQKTDKRELKPDKITLKYPDGAHNAETMLLDPKTRDLYIVTKARKTADVYVAPYPQSTKKPVILKKTGSLPIDHATGGAISADGQHILIRDYWNIFYWPVKGSIVQSLEQPMVRVPYKKEIQGEAVSWFPDGSGYFTVSESPLKQPTDIFIYTRK
ncbi:MAG: hypothetical protein INR69_06950 [Mucilaginibacter polytrichastri]|nr:hypothetical protein [Mucilaginibacter polytrichastri]